MFMYSADQNPTKGLHEVGAILAESVPIEQTPDVRFTGISYGRLGTEEELMAMQEDPRFERMVTNVRGARRGATRHRGPSENAL